MTNTKHYSLRYQWKCELIIKWCHVKSHRGDLGPENLEIEFFFFVEIEGSGGEKAEIKLVGDTIDDCDAQAEQGK